MPAIILAVVAFLVVLVFVLALAALVVLTTDKKVLKGKD